MLPYASKVQAGSYEKWLKVPYRKREPAALETPYKVSCLPEAIHGAVGAMCRKALLDCSATEAHRERQYGNQHVLTRFERQVLFMALPKLTRNRGNGLLVGVVILSLLVLVGCGGPKPGTKPTPTSVSTQPQHGLQITNTDLKLSPVYLN